MRVLVTVLVLLIAVASCEVEKKIMCGAELARILRQQCTPYGEEQPCFGRDWDRQTPREKIKEVLSRIKRHHKLHVDKALYQKATERCCLQACDSDVLNKFCCTQKQADSFYAKQKSWFTQTNY